MHCRRSTFRYVLCGHNWTNISAFLLEIISYFYLNYNFYCSLTGLRPKNYQNINNTVIYCLTKQYMETLAVLKFTKAPTTLNKMNDVNKLSIYNLLKELLTIPADGNKQVSAELWFTELFLVTQQHNCYVFWEASVGVIGWVRHLLNVRAFIILNDLINLVSSVGELKAARHHSCYTTSAPRSNNN